MEYDLSQLSNEIAEIKAIILNQSDDMIPVDEIFAKYIKRSAFYDQVKQGKIQLYKLGKLSFVKRSEFLAAFTPVI